MDVVVSSRQCEVSERFREHVEDKLARLEKHDHRIIRVEVLLERERNSRQPDRQVRVELTAKSKGPVMRAEAAAEDKMAALDLALDKMSAQMRRAADRRKVHRGQRTPESVHQAMTRAANGALPSEEGADVVPTTARATGPVYVVKSQRTTRRWCPGPSRRAVSDWNFADVWERIADLQPDLPAVVRGDDVRTWRRLDQRADWIALYALDSLGRQDDARALRARLNAGARQTPPWEG